MAARTRLDIPRRGPDKPEPKAPGNRDVHRQARQDHRRRLRGARPHHAEDQGRRAQGGCLRARPARFRQGARRRAPGRRHLAGQSVAEKGGAAVVPPQRHERDRGRPRQGRVVGQGRFKVQGLERGEVQEGRLPRRARLRGAPLRLHRAGRGADAVVRQSRRLCRRRHHDRHLGDRRLLRADRQELPHLRRRRHRRRARAAAGRAR